MDPRIISVISNAVDTDVFTPDPSQRDVNKVTIVVISRLVYRKGMDLLAALIPIVCGRHTNVHFVIGGDGPKRVVLEEVIEVNNLQDRVTLLGSVPHEDVRGVLVKGDIFLNCSLTEAFCMAIVEASACGLQVVSTNVGGIPEVLPDDLVWLADPTVDGLSDAIDAAIEDRLNGKVVPPEICHDRVAQYYQWSDIADRTLAVYRAAYANPIASLGQRLNRLHSCGFVFGKLFIIVALIEHLLYLFYSWYIPKESIDLATDLNLNRKI